MTEKYTVRDVDGSGVKTWVRESDGAQFLAVLIQEVNSRLWPAYRAKDADLGISITDEDRDIEPVDQVGRKPHGNRFKTQAYKAMGRKTHEVTDKEIQEICDSIGEMK